MTEISRLSFKQCYTHVYLPNHIDVSLCTCKANFGSRQFFFVLILNLQQSVGYNKVIILIIKKQSNEQRILAVIFLLFREKYYLETFLMKFSVTNKNNSLNCRVFYHLNRRSNLIGHMRAAYVRTTHARAHARRTYALTHSFTHARTYVCMSVCMYVCMYVCIF